MPTYQFEAMDVTGQEIRDFIEAETQDEAQYIIRQLGYFLTKIRFHNDGTQRTILQHVAQTLPKAASSFGWLLLEVVMLPFRFVKHVFIRLIILPLPCDKRSSLTWILPKLILYPLYILFCIIRYIVDPSVRCKRSNVWGIDIGQCAIKALRCHLEGDQVIAGGFDFIEYPKLLSQPEADPEQLIREALETFLSRNEIERCIVAISVPGQSGLTHFFKPPPVYANRLPAIVKFEAQQQIPFPQEEIIWDYQKLVGGMEVDGFLIDAEVGLFAMKRDQVYRALKPFDEADMQLDIVQLAPMSSYNFATHDILTDGPDPDLFDADNPPESIVVLSLGTDATDLVVTNGFRMWQRSIPLGGNHFTKQLTKELKLTFAKAEHLKRNARQAEDPKTVFQAMRPIFKDLVTEVQRSVGYFQGLDRKAKIRGVVLLGNTVKLPGLQQYIAKNLGYEVIPFERFNLLAGDPVLTSPQFSENAMSFGVCYGLCLQGLGKARLSTNLLPRPRALTTDLVDSWKQCICAWNLLVFGSFRKPIVRTYDVFISYRRVYPDKELAEDLTKCLRDAGFTVCFDEDDFLAGRDSRDEMRQKVLASRVTVAVVTSEYFESKACMFEAEMSLYYGLIVGKERLIPFFLERVPLPEKFSDLVGISLRHHESLSHAFERLITTLRVLFRD